MTELEKLVPHRAKMLLLDEDPVFDDADERAESAFTPRRGGVFFDDALDSVPAWAAIEYMAQTAAACAGYADSLREPGSAPRPGLLIGSRNVKLLVDRFAAGERYRVSARCSFSDGETAAFECEIRSPGGAVVASATLSAFRPDDFRGFLSK